MKTSHFVYLDGDEQTAVDLDEVVALIRVEPEIRGDKEFLLFLDGVVDYVVLTNGAGQACFDALVAHWTSFK